MKKLKLSLMAKLLSVYTLTTGKKIANTIDQNQEFSQIVVYSTTALGDFMFSTPSIRAIRERYPDAQIALVIDPKNKEFIEGYKQIDQLLLWDGRWQGMHLFISQLKQLKPQLAISLHAHQPYDIISAVVAGCGYILENNDSAYIASFKKWFTSCYPKDTNQHMIQGRLNLLAPLGCRTDQVEMDIPCAYEHLPKNMDKFMIGFQMGTSNSDLKRRWPVAHFVQLAQQLWSVFPQLEIHLIGAKAEETLAQTFLSSLTEKEAEQIVNHMGQTTLAQLLSVIEQMDVLVTGDTGPLHLAIALKTPVVALLPAPTTASGPYQDLHLHQSLFTPESSVAIGVSAITVEEVFAALQHRLPHKKAAN